MSDRIKVQYDCGPHRGALRYVSADGSLYTPFGEFVNSGWNYHPGTYEHWSNPNNPGQKLTKARPWIRESSSVIPEPPVAPSAPDQAFKSDAGKVQYNLLEDGCGVALNYIAQVMTWAVEVKGYTPNSWRDVPNAIVRYRAALGRHRNAIARGEVLDPESGFPHWAHAACCVIFLLELENFDVK